MRTEMVKVFTLDELAKEVQERVIDRYRNMDYWWDSSDSDMLTEDFEYMLEGTMFEGCEVEWSLRGCQGDGVMLLGEVDNTKLYEVLDESGKFNKHELRRIKFILDYSRFELVRNNYYSSYFNNVRYTDYMPMGYSYTSEMEHHIESLIESIEYVIKNKADSITSEMETIGYETIDYKYSDEYIRAQLEAHEFY